MSTETPAGTQRAKSSFIARLKKWHERIDTLGATISSVAILAVMTATTFDALGRYLFNHPFQGVFEGTQFAMAWIAYLSFAYVQHKRSNITINIISARLTGTASAILEILLLTISLVTFFIIGWTGWVDALDALKAGDRLTGMVDWPIGPAKLIVPVGCALLSLRLLSQIVEAIGQFSAPKKSRAETVQGEML